jgi:2-hydroxychromene-2-carboxylate isomerase
VITAIAYHHIHPQTVIAGLDPAIQGGWTDATDFASHWIAGSSPAMTLLGKSSEHSWRDAMGRTVDFFYGIGSRYSYLASSQVNRLEQDTGASVHWRPLYSTELMKRRGMDPFEGAPSSGQYESAYRTRDVSRWAVLYGIPFHDPDWDTLDWRRLALAAVAADRLDRIVEFTKHLYGAVFGNEITPTDDAGLARIADQAGVDGRELTRLIDDAETARRHDRSIADALAAGVFGVPSFVVDGEMFWGNDRLILLRHHLGAQT